MDRVKAIIYELKKFSDLREDWVILVEGKRDVKALKKLGIENVVEMKGQNYHTIAEKISESKKGVVLLMDFDEHGERIFQKLQKILPTYGLKTDTYFRERLKETGIKYIEELDRWILQT